MLKNCNFVTLHVPLVDATRNMINAESIEQMKHGAVLLNFSREGVVDEAAVLAALDAKKLSAYVCDFPSAKVNGHPHVIALPHLGASTREAEENCAVMVADQVRDYLLDGNVRQCGEFPQRRHAARIGLPHRHRQRQRAEHGRADLDRHGARRGSTSTT